MHKFKFFIYCIVLICPYQSGWGQVSSPLNRFEVDFTKGCAPLTVTVTNTSGNNSDQYLYDADTCVVGSPKYDPTKCPQTSSVTTTTYTYTQPGSYSLVQVLATGMPRGDTTRIEVLPPKTPEFNVTLCNNYGVSVNITDTYYDQFLIDYGDGSPATSMQTHTYPPATSSYLITVSGFFNNGPQNCGDSTVILTPVNNIPAPSLSLVTVTNQSSTAGEIDLNFSLTPNITYILQGRANGTSAFHHIDTISGFNYNLSGLNTIDSIYCFRIAALDKCNNIEVYSNTICSTNIQVTAQVGQNQINWSTIAPMFSHYEITKDGAPLAGPVGPVHIQSETDTAIECNVVYCYQITTVYTDGCRSVSAENCVTGIDNQPPPKVQTLTASVEASGITINWNTPGGISSYQIYRSVNNGTFELIGQDTTLPYVDLNLRPQVNHYCYYITYENACGLMSEPSAVACAIKLTGSNDQNRNIVLDWSPYTGWENGVMCYELEITDESGALVVPPISLSNSATNYLDPINQNRQISYYRIVAISNDLPPFRSRSNIIKIDIPLQIFVPNSFTPNNDGLNDTFTAKGLFINEYSMEIYSRWGELLFHTTDMEQGWNGVYRGSLSPEDTYVFKIQASDPQGRSVIKNGTVHLLRKDN